MVNDLDSAINECQVAQQRITFFQSATPPWQEILIRPKFLTPIALVQKAETAGIAHLIDFKSADLAQPLMREGCLYSLNMSVQTLMNSAHLKTWMHKFRDTSQRITAEITESISIKPHEVTTALFHISILHSNGFRVALDDYDQAEHVQAITAACDIIKLSPLAKIDSRRSYKALKALISRLGTTHLFIVEGVDTQEKLQAAHTLGADAWQGFYNNGLVYDFTAQTKQPMGLSFV